MIDLKEFEKTMQSVTKEEILKRKVKGRYVPYIETIIKKANMIPVGRSVEVDVKDPKVAAAICMATKQYLKKMNIDSKYATGFSKTFFFCGRRNGGK